MPPTVILLTRPGCADTVPLRARLGAALADAALVGGYEEVDTTRLDAQDPRRGYPTPTILVDGHDLFDMPPPPAGQPPT
ncbi:hypothetical protein TBR22_A29820 [Luteitalea sp. TBR-22]|uniref:hypothetical protein n=1 Tax=Luteitalea sp. TBR-22 TaxID=2802971 RepID=UPI001AF1535C|nr:hypothetical protein [Luteitalea sp. TBR-22]BCS33755.1 hypothetical protein TBR22_A29820 [Luteitalea sp. TBR-22]